MYDATTSDTSKNCKKRRLVNLNEENNGEKGKEF